MDCPKCHKEITSDQGVYIVTFADTGDFSKPDKKRTIIGCTFCTSLSNKPFVEQYEHGKLSGGSYYHMAAKCRHCGMYYEFIGPKKEDEINYNHWYRGIKSYNFPCWIEHCENCDNQAVFDLTAIEEFENA